MKNIHSFQSLGISLPRWLKIFFLLLVVLGSAPTYAETKIVVAEGASEVCWGSREAATKIARVATGNDAYAECHALGPGWRFSGMKFSGYEQCTPCGKSKEFRCKITQATYACVNMQKENAEKAAKARAEKAELAKIEKEKANQKKAERESLRKVAKEKKDQEYAQKQAEAKLRKEKSTRDRAAKHTTGSDNGIRETNQTNSMDDMLDASAERPLIKKRLAQERAVYRKEAAEICRGAMQSVDACYAKTSCKRPAEVPSLNECNSLPSYPSRGGRCNPFCLTRAPSPGDICYREDAACRAHKAEQERTERLERAELKSKQSEWESRYGSLSESCKLRAKEREGFNNCQKQYSATCNPKGYEDNSACIEQRMSASGPTEQQARALLKKEWDANAATGKNSAAANKNPATTNFLD